MDRRNFIRLGGAAGVALIARETHAFAQDVPVGGAAVRPSPRAVVAPGGQVGVVTPNGSTLPLRDVGGVKVGHLVASEIEHEFAPGLVCTVWGYNGSSQLGEGTNLNQPIPMQITTSASGIAARPISIKRRD